MNKLKVIIIPSPLKKSLFKMVVQNKKKRIVLPKRELINKIKLKNQFNIRHKKIKVFKNRTQA